MTDLERRTKVGVAWTALATAVAQIVTFVLGVALARLLRVEDFGIFAAILIFLELSSSVVSSGLVAALIQRREIGPQHYATAFMLQLAAAAAICSAIAVVSPWVSLLLGIDETGPVLAVASLYLLILPFISTPTAILRKRIDFKTAGIADVLEQLVAGLIAVATALGGQGVWSLVSGRLGGYAFKALWLARAVRWRPSLHYDPQARRDLLPFALRLVAVNTLNDLASKIDYFVVGRLLGPAALGFYSRAYHLMTFPLTKITNAMNVVLFSAFSDVQHEPAALKRAVLKSLCYASLLTFPFLVGLFWVAEPFVSVVYGEKWISAVAPLRVICFAGLFLSIEPIAVSAIVSRGFVGFEVRRQAIYLVLLAILVPLGTLGGVVGVAWGVLGAAGIFLFMLQRLLERLLGIGAIELIYVMGPAAAACGAMSALLAIHRLIAVERWGAGAPAFLLTGVPLGVASYALALVWMRRRLGEGLAIEVLTELQGLLAGALRRVPRLR